MKLKIQVLGVGVVGKGWRLGSIHGALPGEAWNLRAAFSWQGRARELVLNTLELYKQPVQGSKGIPCVYYQRARGGTGGHEEIFCLEEH